MELSIEPALCVSEHVPDICLNAQLEIQQNRNERANKTHLTNISGWHNTHIMCSNNEEYVECAIEIYRFNEHILAKELVTNAMSYEFLHHVISATAFMQHYRYWLKNIQTCFRWQAPCWENIICFSTATKVIPSQTKSCHICSHYEPTLRPSACLLCETCTAMIHKTSP